MAQTVVALPKGNYKVEVSLNGSAWTNISGQAATVKTSGGDHMVGEQNTADGSAPIVLASNKTKAFKIETNTVYTESASEAFMIVWGRFTGAVKTIFLRFSPAGGNTGNNRFVCVNDAGTAMAVPIESCTPPDLDSGSGDLSMNSFSVSSPKLLLEVVP